MCRCIHEDRIAFARRTQPHDGREGSGEVTLIRKSTEDRYVGQGQRSRSQELFGSLDATIEKPAVRRHADRSAECACEVPDRQTALRGEPA